MFEKKDNILEKLVRLIIRENIRENFERLGIEGCLEAIERIRHPILRARLREYSLKYLKGEL